MVNSGNCIYDFFGEDFSSNAVCWFYTHVCVMNAQIYIDNILYKDLYDIYLPYVFLIYLHIVI